MMSSMKLVQTLDRNVNQLQKNIIEVLNPLLNNPILSGQIINNISLKKLDPTTSAQYINKVPIGINRPLQGWLIIGNNTNCTIWDDQINNMTKSQNLWLFCSSDCLINLYVF